MPPKREPSAVAVAAPDTRANTSRKRRMTEDEEPEDVPVPKKIKSTTAKKTRAIIKTAATKAPTKSAVAKQKEVDHDEDDVSVAKKPKTSKAATQKKAVQAKTAPKIIIKSAAPATVKASTSRATASKASTAKSTRPKRQGAPKAPPKPKQPVDPISRIKIGVKINSAPNQILDVFVFGEGSSGELGLGHKRIDGKPVMDVKRPRLNPFLSAEAVGVVQIACGGMHVLALTRDNKILTWGVNDQGALGRDTTSSASGDGSDSDDEDDSGLDRSESTPAEIDTRGVAPGTKFVQVAASDSASFALTEDGRVYSWGTFRNGDGILGFSKDVHTQKHPVLLGEPRKVISLATGSNHVLALDARGKVQTWGAPEQCQLGRRVVQRDTTASALRPGGLAFRRGVRIARVAAGAYHSFAVDDQGRAWAWGLNNFGQLGVAAASPEDDGGGAGGAVVLEPALVEDTGPEQQLAGRRVADVVGGEHHSLLVLAGPDGEVLSFGRVDGNQLGLPQAHYTPENSLYGERGEPRVLRRPARVGVPPVASGAAGTDSNLVVSREGRVYAWGFNGNYQCGVGETDGDVITPVLVDNLAIRDKKIVYVGCGGQFGVLASVHG